MGDIIEFLKPMIKLDVWTVAFLIAAVCYLIGRLIKGKDIFEKAAEFIFEFIKKYRGLFKNKKGKK
jgi:hypothetical protein